MVDLPSFNLILNGKVDESLSTAFVILPEELLGSSNNGVCEGERDIVVVVVSSLSLSWSFSSEEEGEGRAPRREEKRDIIIIDGIEYSSPCVYTSFDVTSFLQDDHEINQARA